MTLSLGANPGGGTLSGVLTATASGGIAQFSNLTISKAGEGYTFQATTTAGLTSGTSPSFNVTPVGTATTLCYQLSPADYGDIIRGSTFDLSLYVLDQNGNYASNFNGNVTLAMDNNPGGATLGGTVTVAASGGRVDFPNLTLDKSGSGYTIKATASGLAPLVSTPFSVSDQFVVTTQPPTTVVAGAPFGLIVTAEDGAGNVDTSFTGNVSVEDDLTGRVVGGNTTVAAVGGVATFSGLTMNLADAPGHREWLNVSPSGVPAANNSLTTNYFAVLPATASQLLLPGTSGPIGAGSTCDLQVEALDPYGNLDTNFSGSVTIALANNPTGAALGGTTTVAASQGVADFSSLTINKVGQGYTLGATGSGLTAATSPAFDVVDNLAVASLPPTTVVAGAPFGITVEAKDGSGKVDTSFNGDVTASTVSSDPWGSLMQTVTLQAVQGVAVFSGLAVDQAGFYVLGVDGNSLSWSQDLMVNPGAATQLAATSQPPNLTAGAPFNVVISAKDAFGNVDPTYSGGVKLALANPPAGVTLSGGLSATAVNGVAVFSGLSINQTGSGYTLQATATGLGSTSTTAFNVTANGVATQLVIPQQPLAALSAGETFGLTVEAEDAAGTVDTSFHGSVTLGLANNPGGGSLAGTVTVTAVNGVATFSGLSIDTANNVADYYTLQASSSGLSPTTTSLVHVASARTDHLAVLGPAGNVLTGAPFSVTVEALDQYGNDVNLGSGLEVTLSLANNPGGAALGGTVTATESNGVITFSHLTIDKPGGGNTLQATTSGAWSVPSGTSYAFSVTNDQLVVAHALTSVAAGTAFGLVVNAEDAGGHVDASFDGPVTVALVNLGGNNATLGGTLTVTAVNGVAVFSGLAVDQVGTYDLSLGASGVAPAFNSVDITATQLAISTPPPALVTATAPFSLAVAAEDSSGNVDPTFAGPVTLSLAANPGGATLSGTLTAVAVGGVATFHNVSINNAASGYTLQATAAGMAAATTGAFGALATGKATQLVVTAAPPASVAAGSPFGLTVKAEDFLGHTDSSFTGPVTIADANGVLGGTLTVNAVAGVATFPPELSLGQAADDDPLTLTTTGSMQSATLDIAVTPAAANQLVVPIPGTGILTGAAFEVHVFAEDQFGDVDPNFNGSVTLSLGTNPPGANLGGTVTVNAAGGVADFPGLSISKPGSGFTLNAAGAGGILGAGPAFNVTNDQLVFSTLPAAGVTAGSAFSLVVEAENGAGQVDGSFAGSVTVADVFPGQTLSGTTTATAVKGVATFSGLTIGQAGPATMLVAQSSTLPAVFSAAFDVLPAAASRLALQTAPPSHVTAGAPFEIDVAVEDALGNLQTAFTGNVTIAMAPTSANGGLGGTLTVSAVGGVAACTNLTLATIGTGYTLQATAGGLTAVTTAPVNVLATGQATQLVITQQPPSTAAAGSAFAVVVKAEDDFGDVATAYSGSVVAADSSGAALGGTLTEPITGGVASFSLTEDQATPGTTLVLTSSGLTAATTNALTVTALPATQLAVSDPLDNALTNSPFVLAVFAEDQYGNVDPNSSGNVTLTLNNSGSDTLGGTLTATMAAGMSWFSGLTIDNPGTGCTLHATNGTLTGDSTAFDVTADQLAVTTQPPGNVATGAGFGLTIAAQNASGSVDTNFTGSVTVALIDLGNTGATLSGTLTATAAKGVATFSGLTLDRTGSYLLSVIGSSVGPTVTNPLQVTLTALPSVSSVSPTAGPVAGNTQVTITGMNLAGATVKFGTATVAAANIVSDDGTTLVVKSPAGKAGPVNVTVTNAVGTATAPSQFTYVVGPTVTGIKPATGPAAGNTLVTITGANLANATAVTFGATVIPAASFINPSATSISVDSPAIALTLGTQSVDVTVTTAGGPSATSSTDKFTYVAAPTVTAVTTAVSPAAGPAAGGTQVTIAGTNLLGFTAVKFGTTLATSFVSKSATQIVVKSPAVALTTGTLPVDVTVATVGGVSGTSAADQFTFVAAPRVTGVTLNNSGPLAGGTQVTINGTNLANAAAVNFGKTVLTSFISDTATQIVLTPPRARRAAWT